MNGLMQRVGVSIALVGAMCFTSIDGHAISQMFGHVKQLHSPDLSRDCAFFTVHEIAQADPAVPGNGWFAVSKEHKGYREIVALLTAAKLSGAEISLTTTGNLVCGFAEINHVEIL